jgi:membrane glycosyltransferase
MLLFFPKVLSIVLIAAKRRNARAYGGVGRLSLSVFLEIVCLASSHRSGWSSTRASS